ncbi:NAD(P)-binding protein [Xylariaceae sp. FL0016]|nr:NAD(P)-binding protein [Xylariaceae sp. FL0016]
MPPQKTIVVVGATGTQGSSVARTFASLPRWHVRCTSRDPSSPSAQQLSNLGCDVVAADLSDPASLTAAFAGAHAIFVNTDMWGTFRAGTAAGTDAVTAGQQGYATEVAHGRNAARAASAVPTLERYVYSALGPMKRASGGRYPHSYHWESKAAIVELIEGELPGLARKTSLIYLGAYTTNPLLVPKREGGSGEYKTCLTCRGSTRFPMIDAGVSTGPYVRALVEDEEAGTKLLAYDDYLTIDQCLEAWSRAAGKPATFVGRSIEEMHETMGLPLEILDAPAFIEEFGYMAGVEGVVEPAQLKAKVPARGFEEWLKNRSQEELLGIQVVF